MDKQFVATLSTHRVLGNIILPYAVIQKKDQKFLSVKERMTISGVKEYEHDLPEGIMDLIKEAEKYEENEIVKIFSKKKQSSADFFKSVTNETIEKNIRPYVEARMIRCIDIINKYNIPFYFKDQIKNIHYGNEIEIIKTPAETVFHFIKEKEGSKYYLSIKYNEKDLELTDKAGLIVVNNPCRLILENKLFLFDDIDGKKLLPFFTKKNISIPKSSEKKYFETFVRNSIKNYSVEAEGFDITNLENLPKPVIYLENDLNGIPSLILKFVYDFKSIYYANRQTEPKVMFDEENGKYKFYKIVRNYEYENEYINFLINLGLKNSNGPGFYLYKQENEYYPLISWLCSNEQKLIEKGIEINQSFFRDKFNLNEIKLDMKIQMENDWFDIYAMVIIGNFQIPFIKFRRNILKNIREYELPDGKIVILPEEWFVKYRDMFLYSQNQDKSLKIKNFHANILSENIKIPENTIQKNLEKLVLDKKNERVSLPVGLNATLREYQHIGYNYLLQMGDNNLGVCLADDMGLGKTLQTLSVLKYKIERKENIIEKIFYNDKPKQLTLFANNEVSKIKERQATLIVMPASLIHNWYNEIQRFTSELKIYIYTGSQRVKDISAFGDYDILLTTYGTLRVDYEVLSQYQFFYVILDESQVIKNFQSKTYKAVVSLKSRFKLVLTGTPVENSLSDLWAQLNFLNKGLLGNFHFFKEEFITPIEKHKDEEKQKKLKLLIKPFILRRTKQEVANDLPELTEQTIFCDMSDEQEKIYESEKSKIRNSILQNIEQNGIVKSAFVVLQGLTKLRQLANHPAMINENYKYESGKFEEVTRNIDNLVIENHKAIIFSSFVKHLNLFEGYFLKKEYKYSKLIGETRNREEVVSNFQNDPKNMFFLISMKAGGVGLNLTAADYVFILDPWWNPAVENQAINRAHRIGQENKVFVYRFIANNTIEEKIMRLQQRKSELAEIFINSNNPFTELSMDHVLNLFL